jgi:REP element-mobilizing transposase RayT
MESEADSGAKSVRSGAHYVILRLTDALPRHELRAWHDDLDRREGHLRNQHDRDLTSQEEDDLALRSLGKVVRILGRGRGASLLRDPEAADQVRSVLEAGNGGGYQLLAWEVMPNHLQALFTLCDGASLEAVVSLWKAESARRVNSQLGRTGGLWHADVIHRTLVNPLEIARIRESMEAKPVRADAN